MLDFLNKSSNKPREIKLHINGDDNKKAPNLNGQLGRICNNCGGYGYTMSIAGKKLECNDCETTGVANPTNREIQIQLSSLSKDLAGLKKALIKTLVGKGADLDAEEVAKNING